MRRNGRPKEFSLRSCRSSSVNFLNFSQGNLVGNLAGILWGFFLTHRTKAQKNRGKFRSIFRKKFVARKKSFVQNSLCRCATLKKSVFGDSVSSLPTQGLSLKHLKFSGGREETDSPQTPFWTTVSESLP